MPIKRIGVLSLKRLTEAVDIGEDGKHDLAVTYPGESKPLTSRPSKTPIKVEKFNTQPKLSQTDRETAVLTPMRERYGLKPFMRGNLDAGILNRAIARGHIRHVGGDTAKPSANFRFVK